MKYFSPAKINLCLHIIGRRADGYHLLQTAIQFIDFCDELEFKPDPEIRLSPDFPQIAITDNLIYRAARLLQQKTGTTQGMHIEIEKNIPMGAGLGGGSSNAATTLVALNQLWQTGLSTAELAELGGQLGADVPVFIYGQAAWVEGVGEKVTPVDFPERWCLWVVPDCPVSTREIYCTEELTRHTPAITIGEFFEQGGHNDCEPVVRQRYPQVNTIFLELARFAKPRLTGTGSCVYALFETEAQAQKVARQLPPTWQARVNKTGNRSPLYR